MMRWPSALSRKMVIRNLCLIKDWRNRQERCQRLARAWGSGRVHPAEWTVIGSQLAGKLHFYIGDSDDYLRNYSVYRFQDFLNGAPSGNQATFQYGFRKGKDWQPMTNAQLIRIIAGHYGK